LVALTPELIIAPGPQAALAFVSAAAQHADAIMVFGDPLFNFQAPRVVALAAEHHLPAMYLFRQFAKGGLVVYGPDLSDLVRHAAGYVDEILKGTKPSDLPVKQPTKFEPVINFLAAMHESAVGTKPTPDAVAACLLLRDQRT